MILYDVKFYADETNTINYFKLVSLYQHQIIIEAWMLSCVDEENSLLFYLQNAVGIQVLWNEH